MSKLSEFLDEIPAVGGVEVWLHFTTPTATIPVTPPPPETPPATAVPLESPGVDRATQFFKSSNGIQGEVFYVEALTLRVGEPLWFNFQVRNTTESIVGYTILALKTLEGPSAASWTRQDLHERHLLDGSENSKALLAWRDHKVFTTPGTYHAYLGIGFGDDLEGLKAGRIPWEPLSSAVTITVLP